MPASTRVGERAVAGRAAVLEAQRRRLLVGVDRGHERRRARLHVARGRGLDARRLRAGRGAERAVGAARDAGDVGRHEPEVVGRVLRQPRDRGLRRRPGSAPSPASVSVVVQAVGRRRAVLEVVGRCVAAVRIDGAVEVRGRLGDGVRPRRWWRRGPGAGVWAPAAAGRAAASRVRITSRRDTTTSNTALRRKFPLV